MGILHQPKMGGVQGGDKLGFEVVWSEWMDVYD